MLLLNVLLVADLLIFISTQLIAENAFQTETKATVTCIHFNTVPRVPEAFHNIQAPLPREGYS